MGAQLHVLPAPKNLHREPTNPRGFKFSEDGASPYLNPEDGARYLRFFVKDEHGHDTTEPNVRAFYQYLDRAGITKLRRGRCILVDRRELDAAIHPVKDAGGRRRPGAEVIDRQQHAQRMR